MAGSVGVAAAVCTVLFLGLVTTSARAQSLSNVYTTAQDYSSEHNAGSIQGLFCDTPSNHNPYPACEKHAWLAYSVSLGMSRSKCGTCLQITNTASGGGTTTACILDEKQGEGFDLDEPAFNAIDDPNRDGYQSGHMYTNANVVAC